MNVLPMSLWGGALILAVTLLRALALHRVPKRTFVLLWGIVLCRLLIPFSIPSPFPSSAATPTSSIGIPAWLPMLTAPQPSPTAGDLSAASGLPPLTIVWLLGTAVCALYFLLTHLLYRHHYRTALPLESTVVAAWLTAHPLRRRIQIRQWDRAAAPLTYGIWHPVILLPSTLDQTDEDRLRFILTHEFTHIRRFDILTKWLLAAALCVHWFNPLVWAMYILCNRDLELSCDEATVRTLGEPSKSAYALTLIALEETKCRAAPLCPHFGKNAIEERIVSIMKIKKASLLGIALSAALIVCVAIASAASALKPDDESVTNPDSTVRLIEDSGITWTPAAPEGFTLSDITWWTAEEYAAWLEEEKAALQSLVGSGARSSINGDDWFEWTQEKVDETILMYEQTLQNIQNGWKVSKRIAGENVVVITANIDPDEAAAGVLYGGTYVVSDGDAVVVRETFGPYQTLEEYREAIKAYFTQKVQDGEMTPEEMDKQLNDMNVYGPENG